MKPGERDELLGRLDERTRNTFRLVEEQERHLKGLNDSVSKNMLNIDRNHNRLAELEAAMTGGASIKFSKKSF